MQDKFNRDRLVKLLNQSTTPFDNEALSAIRNANSMVKKAGLVWDHLIDGDDPSLKAPHTIYRPEYSAPPPKEPPKYEVDEDEIRSMFIYIRAHAYESFDMTFIDDVEQKFEDYRRLTWKQLKSLRNIYETIKRHAGGN